MDTSLNRLDDLGTEIGTVNVDIDYEILNHFSRHLYRSPSKAVEELVSNGFDALARSVYVYLPGAKYSNSALVVWDDGESMDAEGFQQLWWIASSPKASTTERVATSADGDGDDEGITRRLIGKFGIGKLASYAIGERLTHLCHKNNQYLRVTVDYRGAPKLGEMPPGESPLRYSSPIVELTETEVKAYLSAILDDTADGWAALWEAPSWTVAIVDELKPDVVLPHGRLRWVIGTGMPLRDNFAVYIEDDPVSSTLGAKSAVVWDAGTPRVVNRLKADWASGRKAGNVSGEISFAEVAGEKTVVFPNLGSVTFTVRIFDQTLRAGKPFIDRDIRNWGFFVYVRDRLLNPDDDTSFIDDPSYATFYRTQFVIHADGLDSELLADRERLQRNSPRTEELALLQRALYLEARTAATERENEIAQQSTTAAALPFELRELYRDPLTALLLKEGYGPVVDPSEPAITHKAAAEDEPIAVLEATGFVINYAHPLLSELEKRLPRTKRNREAHRVIELFAVADRLLEGYMWDLGITEEYIRRVAGWRDALLRAMAAKLSGLDAAVIEAVSKASYAGDKEFEDALAELFRLMGFDADRDGAPGMKDILVVAPIGEDHFGFVVEAKGCGTALKNSEAKVDAAANHRDAAGVDWAIVVAREFAGFKTKETPAVLAQCHAVSKVVRLGGTEIEKSVSVVTVECLLELYKAMRTFYYPLTVVPDLLRVVEAPSRKLERIRCLQHPTENFDFAVLLEELWELQRTEGERSVIPIKALKWKRPEWKEMQLDDFKWRIFGLEALSRGLIRTTGDDINMLQSPEIVAEQIRASVDAGAG